MNLILYIFRVKIIFIWQKIKEIMMANTTSPIPRITKTTTVPVTPISTITTANTKITIIITITIKIKTRKAITKATMQTTLSLRTKWIIKELITSKIRRIMINKSLIIIILVKRGKRISLIKF